jgi:flavin reductase (DIM6/NTAB) family NADH-FMN oxidoreductase RutF
MMEQHVREGLHLIANGVFVIATEYQDQLRGFTATWVSQVSYDQPIVMISVAKEHETYPLIVGANMYAVNVLGSTQSDLARHFGHKKPRVDEVDLDYFCQEEGRPVPILKDALAVLICHVISSFDVKDHTLFVAEVVDADVCHDGVPLIFWSKNGYAQPEAIQ